MLENFTKRGISMILALVMVLSVVPYSAFAAEADDAITEEAVVEQIPEAIAEESADTMERIRDAIEKVNAMLTAEPEAEPETEPETTPAIVRKNKKNTTAAVAEDHEHVAVASDKVFPKCETEGMQLGTYCSVCGITLTGREAIPALGHDMEPYEGKLPTYQSNGWEPYEECSRCIYNTRVEIPKLETPAIEDFDTFLIYTMFLEDIAYAYTLENPGNDPLALMIKYVRTGVDRYNSGSWGIMAGYEDPAFAEYVVMIEEMANAEATCVEEMFAITSLKNINCFELPNGDYTDIGHMFGTMDMTYHNNYSQNHADVGGWVGDLVNLLEFADYGAVSGTLEEMVADIRANYLLQYPDDSEVGSFSETDMYGDLDAMYLMDYFQKNGYEYEPGVSGLTVLMMEYFYGELSMETRAAYLLNNRLDGVSTRNAVREAVYNTYTTNKMISTLENTEEFVTDDLETLRKAVCYAFADYICELAGDYVEVGENSLFTVFSTENANLAPGINQQTNMATTADGKQIVYYLATADITRDDVNLYANYNANDPTQGWEMSRVLDQALAAEERHSDPDSELYIENYNVVAAVNGAGFDMGTGEPSGVLVMDGVEYHSITSAGFVGILKDGTPVIGTKEEYNTIYKGQVQEAIACFGSRLIEDGKIVEGLTDELASRTAIGFTKTGKVVLLVLDGRQEPFSAGGGYATLAQIMLEAGCVEATNLDGGGSSTFVAQMPGDEELSVVNRPSDGFARSVSTSWMIVSTAPSSTAFDHATLETGAKYLTPGASTQISAVGISPSGNAVALPEGTTWAVSDETVGSITEDGLFTALALGEVNVYLMLDDVIVGSQSLVITQPDNIYFVKTNLDTVYGATSELPVKLLYQGKEMAFTANDIVFSLSNKNAGTVSGLSFTAISDENSGITNTAIYAALANDNSVSVTLRVAIYKQGELTFDFEQATGGDRQFAWYREVTNAVFEDDKYVVIEPTEKMTASYILAIDMTHIPIPGNLSELTYMLPGSDIEGANAWTFLCQLAERISTMTEITAQVQYDPNFELDISEMKIINDYFTLTEVVHDEENCTLNLTLKWIKQTQAIDSDAANPMCIVNGLKLTPKDGAQWNENSQLTNTLSGTIGYTIYMRASALYSFASKTENQEYYELYNYINPDDDYDKGGYFSDVYTEFNDSYTLVNQLKEGWYHEDSGYAYYVAGEKLTGIHLVEGLYYDFGESGYKTSKTTYTGLLYEDGKGYYASLGVLKSGWQTIGENYYYFNPTTFAMHTGVSKVEGKQYTFNDEGVLVRGVFVKTDNGTRYYWAGRILVSRWIELEEGIYRADHNGYICYGNYPVIEAGREACTWWAFDEETGIRIGICDGFIQREGKTYYCENGAVFYGAKETENGIIYCGTNGYVPVGGSCYISDSLDSKAGLENGYYGIGADGYVIKDGFVTISGKTYYFDNYVRAKGFTKVGEKYYFFNAGNGTMFSDANLWVSGSNAYGIASGYYYFQADGSMYVPDPNGEKKIVEKDGKLYLTVDGVNQTNGLNELDGDYYYANTNGTLAVNTVVYMSKFNDLIAPGNGYFAFDAEGKLVKTGFVTAPNGYTYYYEDLVRAKGFTKLGEKYYFFNTGSGAMQCDITLWVGGSNPYGIASGYYYFQADGSMYVPDPNGEKLIVEKDGKLYLTVDGVNQTNGLNELDGAYYYANTNGTLAVNTVVYMSKFNDLIAPGNGYFAFDAEGKLVKTGFVTAPNGYTYYYEDLVRAKGFTKLGEKYYFFNTGSGAMQCDITLWVGGSNPYGIASGYYYFQADGSMYVPDPNGEKKIVEKDGKLYLTVDGVNQTNGLNELDGDYYYANTNGTLAVNTVVYMSKFNDLIAPGSGYFAFGADGKLIKTGFVVASNGYTYYYNDLVRAKGLTKIGDDYYFFNTGSGAMSVNAKMWIAGSNAYGLKGGYYNFGSDGKMITE